jgi:glyoxylase-like metal-dependent hydrolase (beta-lactamase superfamily II)
MKIAERAEVLEITMKIAGRQSAIHPLLLLDDGDGATLIDTGMPGQLELIREHLDRLGIKMSAIKRIILTHQDIDHIGGAAELVKATGAEVMAHADDVPYIEGVKPLIKMNRERIEKMTESLPENEREAARRMMSNPPSVDVDLRVHDGEELDFHGGMIVVHTPGHTPGHVSIYLKKPRILVSGDALRVEEGKLVGPAPGATPDMDQAVASLRKLLPFEIDRVLCYHGGLSPSSASARIRELADGAQ